VLPYRAALAVGRFHATVSYAGARSAAATARSRMRRFLSEKTRPPEIRRAVWVSWRNAVLNGVDMLRLPDLTSERLRLLYPDTAALEPLQTRARAGGGAIVALCHTGAWPLAPAVCRLNGLPVFTIALPQQNPLLELHILRLHMRTGVEVLARSSQTPAEVLSRLEAGRVLVLPADSRPRTGGIRVPFLNGEALVSESLAAFARRSGIPLVPCAPSRIGLSRHGLRLGAPISRDNALSDPDDVSRMTAAVFAAFGRVIAEDPGQWFWFSKHAILEAAPCTDSRSA
jgi:lauroyl/myristoyl acyltransferase